MKLTTVFAAAFVATATAHIHNSTEGQRTCGTDHDDLQILESERIAATFVEKVCSHEILKEEIRVCKPMSWRLANPVTIPVWYHVIHDKDTGRLTQKQVQDQFDQTNKDFAGEEAPKDVNTTAKMDITFELAGVTYTDNSQWFGDGQLFESQIKSALAVDNTYNFNQYFTDFRQGLLGFCWYPNDFAESSNMHGCVNLFSSVPGGSSTGYNEGKTTTHETGHGIGLYHTFQGGCSNGDLVDDTCPQRSSTAGCPTRATSSCGGSCTDPIHNYMDYSTDTCMYEFTEGQNVRANNQLSTFRPSLYLGKEQTELIRQHMPQVWDEANLHSAKAEAKYMTKRLNKGYTN